MTRCYTAPYSIPAATLGPENPLPDIRNNNYIHCQIELTKAVPKRLATYIDKGNVSTLLPYTQQDFYGRDKKDRLFKAVILENDHLKAVFLPELGGRLWSLWDKDGNRELLYRNPVFQPGNLALRNAWFSGGVEFNVSIKGHHPMTCSSMFARHITMADGTPGLRMYEYERIRGVAYGLDAWLPEDSRVLLIRPRIENTTDHEVWTYWWSNIAVPYTDGMRIIVPAEKTFTNFAVEDHYYLDFADVPVLGGVDISHPRNVKIARDYFFYIPDRKPKWVAAVDETGSGLVQCSTRELKGRKLFVWGNSPGGDNWKQFLSEEGNAGYVEIQAGLARTQLEHLPLPAGKTYTWVEAYGAVEQAPERLHGPWKDARGAVEVGLAELLGENWEGKLNRLKTRKAVAGEMIHCGSGWGTLEKLRRTADGEVPLSATYDFPESALGAGQLPWLDLLQQGWLDAPDPMAVPVGYLVDAGWRERLERSMERRENRNWFSWMHLGLMRYADGDVAGALRAMEESLALAESPWVHRNLAMLWGNERGDLQKALGYMERAVALKKDNRWLWLDMAVLCQQAEAWEKWVALYPTIPETIGQEGRLKLYTAAALTRLGRWEEATAYLNPDLVIPDIQEGENLITSTWLALYGAIISEKTGITDPKILKERVLEEYPLGKLDFRMQG